MMARFPLLRQILTGTSGAWVRSGPFCPQKGRPLVARCGRDGGWGHVVQKPSRIHPMQFVPAGGYLTHVQFPPDCAAQPCGPHRRPEALGSLMGLKVAPPTATCLFSDSRLNVFAACIPRVPIQHRVAPGISGNHSPCRLVVRVLQEAEREPEAAAVLRYCEYPWQALSRCVPVRCIARQDGAPTGGRSQVGIPLYCLRKGGCVKGRRRRGNYDRRRSALLFDNHDG